MRKTDVTTLVDFMYWTTHRLLTEASHLSADEFTAPTAVTTRNLRGTLVHELDVEWSWRLNLQGVGFENASELAPEDFPDIATLAARWRQDEAEMRAWIEGLSDDDLQKPVVATVDSGRFPLWTYLVHIFTHALQQQADAATLLTLAGRSPGEIGLLNYLDTVHRV